MFSLVYHFCSLAICADGSNPDGPVSVARNGDIYATTAGGTDGNVYGAAVQITPAGVATVLHSFCSQASCADGANPYAGLVLGANGKYYGATYRGGTYEGGTIFDLSTTGTLTTLHSVGAKVSGGWEPYGTLYLATDGNFYGTTVTEGAAGEGGTIFNMTPGGKFTTLYSFCAQPSCADGASPYAGVIQATDGNFYGTTTAGGTTDQGAVYKLSMGLPPFVKTVPAEGSGRRAYSHSGQQSDRNYGGELQRNCGYLYRRVRQLDRCGCANRSNHRESTSSHSRWNPGE